MQQFRSLSILHWTWNKSFQMSKSLFILLVYTLLCEGTYVTYSQVYGKWYYEIKRWLWTLTTNNNILSTAHQGHNLQLKIMARILLQQHKLCSAEDDLMNANDSITSLTLTSNRIFLQQHIKRRNVQLKMTITWKFQARVHSKSTAHFSIIHHFIRHAGHAPITMVCEILMHTKHFTNDEETT